MSTLPAPWLAPFVAVVLASGAARASDPAGAEALFRDGRERLAAGDLAAACAKFAESERLDAMPGTLLNLATCHETEGLLATAWAEFVSAGELATARGDAGQADEAHRRAAALVPRLPHLTIVLDVPPPAATVHRDDVELANGSLGASLPVDPGAHRVVVRAPGFEPLTLDVTLAEAEARDLHVPALSPRARTPPPAPVVLEERPRPVPSDGRDARLGWVIGGAGVALAVTSGVLFAVAVSADHTASQGCGYRGTFACTKPALGAGRERDTLSTISTISGSVGIAGIAVGAWLLLRPSPDQPARAGVLHPVLIPEVSARGSALTLRQSF